MKDKEIKKRRGEDIFCTGAELALLSVLFPPYLEKYFFFQHTFKILRQKPTPPILRDTTLSPYANKKTLLTLPEGRWACVFDNS